ncbi:MAG: hypothetical protein VB144_04330 [Clostridia bacterium]|nr:hypothetical protein [Clostridia bacterium]
MAMDLGQTEQRNDPEAGVAPERGKARRYGAMPIASLVILALALTWFVWFMSHGGAIKLGLVNPTEPMPVIAGRLAPKLEPLLKRSDALGSNRAEEEIAPIGSGRWDPFQSLAPEPVKIVLEPEQPSAPPPPPSPEPEPPQATLTGVIGADFRKIALLSVDGQTQMLGIGDSPYHGGVVKSITDDSITVSFLGKELRYQLGGEHR